MQERIPYKSCPLCSSSDFTPFHVGDCSNRAVYNERLSPKINWMKCSGCGHVFTEGFYTSDAQDILFKKTNESQQVGHKLESNRVIAADMIEKVLPYRASGRWLDVGFGNGSLLFTAEEYGFEPVGVDLRPDTVAQMQALGFEAYCMPLEEMRFDQPVSVISYMDVVEHVPFPKPFLEAGVAALEPGGVALVSMPNCDSFLWRMMDQAKINPFWGEMEHYHNFGRDRLYDLLREVGLEPVRYGVSKRYRVCMEVVARKPG